MRKKIQTMTAHPMKPETRAHVVRALCGMREALAYLNPSGDDFELKADLREIERASDDDLWKALQAIEKVTRR